DLPRTDLLLGEPVRRREEGRMVVERELFPAPATAGERFVNGDPRQPGGEAGTTRELPEMSVGADPRVLRDILRLRIVPQDRPGRSKDPLVVATHQYLEQSCVAREDLGDHDVVGRREHSGVVDLHLWQHVGPPFVLQWSPGAAKGSREPFAGRQL